MQKAPGDHDKIPEDHQSKGKCLPGDREEGSDLCAEGKGEGVQDTVPEEGSAVPKGESGGKGIGYLSGEKGEAEQMVLETVREACRMRLDDLMVQKQIYNKEKTSV